MADSTVTDINKMKVVELRKELKSRGLAHTGDKADLVTRLQAAMAQDDHGDITLDSDEIDSDGVLDDDDDKSQSDIALDDPAVEEALADQPPPPKEPETKPLKTLKRKFTGTDTNGAKTAENKEGGSKKIVLNRTISITTKSQESTASPEDKIVEEKEEPSDSSNKVKITANVDTKSRLEMRAKRFGLSADKTLTDEQRKEARKLRFGQTGGTTTTTTTTTVNTGAGGATLSENLEKLKKRAERFGQSVSKIMTDIELKEKLEKRKAKFGAAAVAN